MANKRVWALLAALHLTAAAAHAEAQDQDSDTVLDVDEYDGDTDGDGIPDVEDDDDDNDGVVTRVEVERAPPSGNTDGDALPDYRDDDDDGDQLPTAEEVIDLLQPRNTDGDALFDYLDPDDDNDGELTVVERASAPPEPDVNLNGVPDHLDAAARGSQWPSAIPRDADCAIVNGRLACWDYDQDGDGVLTKFEANQTQQADTDRDGTPDFMDADDDDDRIPSALEGADPNHDGNPEDALQSNVDVPNYLTNDDDGDSVLTTIERPNDQNQDTDSDGTPDHLDQDDDGDGTPTLVERGPIDQPPPDQNGDGIPDYLDPRTKVPSPMIDGGVIPLPDAAVLMPVDAGTASTPADASVGAADASVTRDATVIVRDASVSDPDDEEGEGSSSSSKSGGGCSTRAGGDTSYAWLLGLSALAAHLLTRRRKTHAS